MFEAPADDLPRKGNSVEKIARTGLRLARKISCISKGKNWSFMQRRDFFRTIGFGGACLFSKESFQAKPEPARPNILLIMADDLGFSDLGCYGSEIATPNLDRLAHTGMRFTQFYNAARCCPSRASLMTGLYPHQTGLGHMWRDFGLPAYRGHLNDRCVTIAEVLRAAGYRTYMSGKWHLGTAKEHLPNARGFERFFGTTRGSVEAISGRRI